MMQATIKKWGNSLALRIPQAVARQIHVEEGDPVELNVAADALQVRPARPRYRLADLMRKVTPANRHKETDWGTPQGKEVW
jgi:antitoxin MazE